MEYRKMKILFDELAEESYEDFVKALIYFEKGISDEKILNEIYNNYIENDEVGVLKKEDRLRTCYMYACILYLQDEVIDNATIRNLFDIPEKQKYKASRILKDSLENGDLILVDEEVGHKARKYIPFWG